MADEYITKQDAIRKAKMANHDTNHGGVDWEQDERTEYYINEIPAADVAPVVRGRWVHGEYGPYCSNCDGYPPTRKRPGHPGETEFYYTKFCPNCGADMQEVTPNG